MSAASTSSSIIGQWENVKVVGKGGSSTVYKAYLKTDPPQAIAVKQIDTDGLRPDQISGIQLEIAMMKELHHPNIISFLGMEQTSNKIYIFMEYANRGSLRQYYQKRGPLKEAQVASCIRQILTGLAYLHSKGIAHRDVKCANCLLTATKECKLADFGASKQLETDSIVSGLKGTPHWMAPEVIKGTQQQTGWFAADIWSLGCTVVEMLTGKLPFAMYDNPMTAMYHIANGESPPIGDVEASQLLRSFVTSCCSVDPTKRPTISQLLEHDFIRLQQQTNGTVCVTPATPGETPDKSAAAAHAAHAGRVVGFVLDNGIRRMISSGGEVGIVTTNDGSVDTKVSIESSSKCSVEVVASSFGYASPPPKRASITKESGELSFVDDIDIDSDYDEVEGVGNVKPGGRLEGAVVAGVGGSVTVTSSVTLNIATVPRPRSNSNTNTKTITANTALAQGLLASQQAASSLPTKTPAAVADNVDVKVIFTDTVTSTAASSQEVQVLQQQQQRREMDTAQTPITTTRRGIFSNSGDGIAGTIGSSRMSPLRTTEPAVLALVQGADATLFASQQASDGGAGTRADGLSGKNKLSTKSSMSSRNATIPTTIPEKSTTVTSSSNSTSSKTPATNSVVKSSSISASTPVARRGSESESTMPASKINKGPAGSSSSSSSSAVAAAAASTGTSKSTTAAGGAGGAEDKIKNGINRSSGGRGKQQQQLPSMGGGRGMGAPGASDDGTTGAVRVRGKQRSSTDTGGRAAVGGGGGRARAIDDRGRGGGREGRGHGRGRVPLTGTKSSCSTAEDANADSNKKSPASQEAGQGGSSGSGDSNSKAVSILGEVAVVPIGLPGSSADGVPKEQQEMQLQQQYEEEGDDYDDDYYNEEEEQYYSDDYHDDDYHGDDENLLDGDVIDDVDINTAENTNNTPNGSDDAIKAEKRTTAAVSSSTPSPNKTASLIPLATTKTSSSSPLSPSATTSSAADIAYLVKLEAERLVNTVLPGSAKKNMKSQSSHAQASGALEIITATTAGSDANANSGAVSSPLFSIQHHVLSEVVDSPTERMLLAAGDDDAASSSTPNTRGNATVTVTEQQGSFRFRQDEEGATDTGIKDQRAEPHDIFVSVTTAAGAQQGLGLQGSFLLNSTTSSTPSVASSTPSACVSRSRSLSIDEINNNTTTTSTSASSRNTATAVAAAAAHAVSTIASDGANAGDRPQAPFTGEMLRLQSSSHVDTAPFDSNIDSNDYKCVSINDVDTDTPYAGGGAAASGTGGGLSSMMASTGNGEVSLGNSLKGSSLKSSSSGASSSGKHQTQQGGSKKVGGGGRKDLNSSGNLAASSSSSSLLAPLARGSDHHRLDKLGQTGAAAVRRNAMKDLLNEEAAQASNLRTRRSKAAAVAAAGGGTRKLAKIKPLHVNINAAAGNPSISVSTSVNLGGLRSKSAGVPITECAGLIGLSSAVPLPDSSAHGGSQRLPPMINSDGNPMSLALASLPVRFIQSAPAVSRSINLPPLGSAGVGGGVNGGLVPGAIGPSGGIADGDPTARPPPMALYSVTPTIRSSMHRLSLSRLRPLETQEEGSEHGSERSTGRGTRKSSGKYDTGSSNEEDD